MIRPMRLAKRLWTSLPPGAQRTALSVARHAPTPRRLGVVRAPATIFGAPQEIELVSKDVLPRSLSYDGTTLVNQPADAYAYFCYPRSHSVLVPPPAGLPVEPGRTYTFTGAVSGQGILTAHLIFFDEEAQVAQGHAHVRRGRFYVSEVAPDRARSLLIAVRCHGPGSFSVGELTLEAEESAHTNADAKRVVMIVFNEVHGDGRVLKAIGTLTDAGYDVTVLGTTRKPGQRSFRLRGARALLFPNQPLSDSKDRAFTWQHMVAYHRAAMWSTVEALAPDVIHTHDFHAVALGCDYTRRLRAAGHGTRWIHDFHEYVLGYEHLGDAWQQAILVEEDRGTPEMDLRLTVSPMISEWLTERFELEEPPLVVLNTPEAPPEGAPPLTRTARGDAGVGDDVPVVVYTGGVNELRGLHTVIEAMEHSAHPFHFLVVTQNQGPYLERLKAMAEAAGKAHRLSFHPYVKSHEVPDYVRSATLGIMPFRRYGNTDASLPTKLFDYLRAGLPSVASNCTLLERFMGEHRFGEIFEVEDAEACARAIDRVIEERADYVARIEAATELLATFTWEHQAKQMLAAYDRLLAG